jgi:small-conductance mechanosensitive channel
MFYYYTMALTTPVVGNIFIKIITAILILLIGFVAGKLAGLLINKLLSVNNSVKRKKASISSLAKGLSSFISLCIYIATVIFALSKVGILQITLRIIFIALLVFVIGAAFFALFRFMTNLIFGLNIITSKKFDVGDNIKIKKIEGKIVKIGLAYTQVRTGKGDLFVFPNKMFYRNKVIIEKQLQKA